MDFLGAGWLWLYAGAGLMLAEIATPGFVMFFFGLSAATVGLLVLALPENVSPGAVWQLALFSFFSLLYLFTLRRTVKAVFTGDKAGGDSLRDDLAGRTGVAVSAISRDFPGRVEIGDAEWDATSATPIPAGTRVKVVSRTNLTLSVEALH